MILSTGIRPPCRGPTAAPKSQVLSSCDEVNDTLRIDLARACIFENRVKGVDVRGLAAGLGFPEAPTKVIASKEYLADVKRQSNERVYLEWRTK